MYLQLIQSVNPIIPSKGTNAGKQMFVINGKHWSKTEPNKTDTHVCLEDVDVDGTTYTNVIGFSQDSRMSIESKLALLDKAKDGAYAQAYAMLLR
jgi:hypothetical protein